MAKSNIEIVGQALDILLENELPYLIQELQSAYKDQWWQKGVEPCFRDTKGLRVKEAKGTYEERLRKGADVQFVITLFLTNWNNVFHNQLGGVTRNYVHEISDIRNSWAHQSGFSIEDTLRALDTVTRLLQATANTGADEAKQLHDALLRRSLEEESKKRKKQMVDATNVSGKTALTPWRQIATPHPDVAAGRYQQAEFAADLFQVITNQAEKEYLDPAEFFNRTYLTEGLSALLKRAWSRLSELGGDPVVQLKTNFGGGKTHSMLALYHLFGGKLKLVDVPDIEKILPDGVASEKAKIPVARRAVLVGTQISPNGSLKPDGTKVNTLWGELAWQLGTAAGKPKEAFNLIAEDDAAGVSPGAEKLARLLKSYGPCLILIDEWVAFARQVYGKEGLPSGGFEANITFVQALTEAAKTARNCMLVASLPASDHEKGGPFGEKALEHIENVFVRVAVAWQPATGDERFEIVRRRLFEPIKDLAARDAVCREFIDMYAANRADFPAETRQGDYLERLKNSYPIHPEFFDRLYLDWSTLERFQQTRGVLRLMAAIIYELWDRNDAGALIMPGFVPLDNNTVRTTLSDYLPTGWSAVLDRDVDGAQSRPLALDRDNPNLNRYSASRRVARTVFFGSAPSVTEQNVRGLDELNIKLGCVQPGENVSAFGDALRRLSEELTYLYQESGRYYFDTRPTIGREAANIAERIRTRPHEIEDEVSRRLRDIIAKRKWGEFTGVHADPKGSGDVPDEDSCRLVIIGPAHPHRKDNGGSPAVAFADEVLTQRDNSPRLYRNMLVFLAADNERYQELGKAVSLWKAWEQIYIERDDRNLTTSQVHEVEAKRKNYTEIVQAQILETYCHALLPKHKEKKSASEKEYEWGFTRLQGGEHLVERVSTKLLHSQELIKNWSAATLLIELDRYLWKNENHLSIKQLWEYLAQYLYLPRLRDREVLVEAVRQGVASNTWSNFFGYASAVGEDGHYLGLVAGALPSVTLDGASVIVKPAAVKVQRESEAHEEPGESVYMGGKGGEGHVVSEGTGDAAVEPKKEALRRFHGSIDLDSTRLGRAAGQIADEIVSHLAGLVGAKVTISLEISAETPEGFSEDVVRTVSENAKTLKFKNSGFEQ